MTKLKETTFTPGPWAVIHKTSNHGAMAHMGTEIRAGDTSLADIRWNGHNEEHGEANARLIAAAPELLAALQSALWYLEFIKPAALGGEGMKAWETRKKCEDAIAKVTCQ